MVTPVTLEGVTWNVTHRRVSAACGKLSGRRVNPEPRHILEAFRNWYYEEYGTFAGMAAAYEWWTDPGLKCSIVKAGRGGNRCTIPCEFCRELRRRELHSESQAA